MLQGRSNDNNLATIEDGWRVHLSRGARAIEAGQYDQAQAHFAISYRLAPWRAETCLALGRELARRGQLEQAEPLLRYAWRTDSSLVAAVATLARLLGLNLRRFNEAHELLDQALRRHPDDLLLLVVRGELLLEAGEAERACVAFETVLAKRDVPAARHGLGRSCNARGIELSESGEHEAALFWFKRATHLDASWAAPYLNLGVAFSRIGRYTRARAAYERAIAIDGSSPLAFFNLANVLRLQGARKEAIRAYQRALELDPHHRRSRLALAEILAEEQAGQPR